MQCDDYRDFFVFRSDVFGFSGSVLLLVCFMQCAVWSGSTCSGHEHSGDAVVTFS